MSEETQDRQEGPWTGIGPGKPVDPAYDDTPALPDDFTKRVSDRVRAKTSFVDLFVLILAGFSAVVLGFLHVKKGRTQRRNSGD